MNGRHFTFWLVTFLVLAAALWLLHDILLPFVAGIALAYVHAPIADRMQHAGVNRTVAALGLPSLRVSRTGCRAASCSRQVPCGRNPSSR